MLNQVLVGLWLTLPVLAGAPRAVIPLDREWRFLKADAPGAEAAKFSDRSWRTVDVPHDWSIEGPFDEKNATGGAGGFLPGGVGWYRKQFTLPAEYAKRRVFIEFDGVMANSEVWINGFSLGKRPYGYVSFQYELTGHLQFGKPNVLAVRADNSAQPASRWYTGAGIYRHVRLVVTDPVHLVHWSAVVQASRFGADLATLTLRCAVTNQGEVAKRVSVSWDVSDLGRSGSNTETQPQTVEPGKTVDFTASVDLSSPRRWEPDHPVMYESAVVVREGTATLDNEFVPFGIREFHFDPNTGFWMNGRNFKIKGVCLHGDAGGLGTAVPLAAWERRLAALKAIGVNAIRTAHNPPAPEFLDLCDRMGFLVMDEMFDCWTVAKNPYDYHQYFREWSKIDTRDTVLRDRNHPSIILYSAGNEIHDTPKADLAKEILSGLVEVFHRYDATRPVTQALFRPNVSHDYDNGLADLLDVVGQNYRENEILAAHAAKPSRKIIGTENQHGRGVWLALRDNAPYAGQFLWAGIDYLGESRAWPLVASSSGLLDHTGAMKPMGYERQSWWSEKPMVYMARRVAARQAAVTDPGYEPGAPRQVQTLYSDWTPATPAARGESVEVYSNCEEVELLLNGKSLGSKGRPADASARVWLAPFEAGTLRAVGRNQGREAAAYELSTAGKAAKILLRAERGVLSFAWDDVAYLTAVVVDEKGVLVPDAGQAIRFAVTGPGTIAAVDSADNASHEPFQASERKAYQGWSTVVVRAAAAGPFQPRGGRIVVTASSPGLAGASVTIETIKGK